MAGNPFPSKGGTATATKAPPAAASKAPPAAASKGSGLDVANGADDPTSTAAPAGVGASASGDPFAEPSGMSDYKFADFNGELLLIRPDEIDQMVTKVSKGELQDFVRMDVIRMDNDNERCDDVISFHQAIVRTLRKVLNGPNDWVLGRLDQGENTKGNPPYILTPATEEEKTRAYGVMAELGLI